MTAGSATGGIMTARLVPCAIGWLSPKTSTITGIMTDPPPSPITPLKTPTTTPNAIKINGLLMGANDNCAPRSLIESSGWKSPGFKAWASAEKRIGATRDDDDVDDPRSHRPQLLHN